MNPLQISHIKHISYSHKLILAKLKSNQPKCLNVTSKVQVFPSKLLEFDIFRVQTTAHVPGQLMLVTPVIISLNFIQEGRREFTLYLQTTFPSCTLQSAHSSIIKCPEDFKANTFGLQQKHALMTCADTRLS